MGRIYQANATLKHPNAVSSMFFQARCGRIQAFLKDMMYWESKPDFQEKGGLG